MAQIINNLYLGNENDSKNSHLYDVIINCTSDLPFYSNTTQNIRVNVKDNGDHRQIIY